MRSTNSASSSPGTSVRISDVPDRRCRAPGAHVARRAGHRQRRSLGECVARRLCRAGRLLRGRSDWVVERLHLGEADFVANPVWDVICGAFMGPGSQTMVVSLASGGMSVPFEGWAVFRRADGSWQLVMPPGNGAKVSAAGSDIRETVSILRPGDQHCCPTGGTSSRIWHWNGTRFTASPWKQATAAIAPAETAARRSRRRGRIPLIALRTAHRRLKCARCANEEPAGTQFGGNCGAPFAPLDRGARRRPRRVARAARRSPRHIPTLPTGPRSWSTPQQRLPEPRSAAWPGSPREPRLWWSWPAEPSRRCSWSPARTRRRSLRRSPSLPHRHGADAGRAHRSQPPGAHRLAARARRSAPLAHRRRGVVRRAPRRGRVARRLAGPEHSRSLTASLQATPRTRRRSRSGVAPAPPISRMRTRRASLRFRGH